MKLAVVGSRHYKDKSRVYHEINQLRKRHNRIDTIVSGGEPSGVDRIGKEYAEENKLKYVEYPAKWGDMTQPCLPKTNDQGEVYNALAGFNRNTTIVEGCDLMLAIHVNDSPGTKDSIKKAKVYNKILKVVEIKK